LPLATHARHILTHTTNQLLQTFLDMDAPIANKSRPDSVASYHMPNLQMADPVSPRSAVNALLAFDNVPQDTLRELIAGLCATISKREEETARHKSTF
jgi:hypothetical protein